MTLSPLRRYSYLVGFDNIDRALVIIMDVAFPNVDEQCTGLRSIEPALHDVMTLSGALVAAVIHLELPAASGRRDRRKNIRASP